MDNRATRWDGYYTRAAIDSGDSVDWVTPHLEDRPPPRAVLELGCGLGAVSERLHRAGYTVLATDFSSVALRAVAARVPDLPTLSLDLTAPLPFAASTYDIVVADLCLHYFDTPTTAAILRQIARVLRGDGVLLFRVNSATDTRHGAGVGIEVERGYYDRDGHRKRFFDEPMLLSFFVGWTLLTRVNHDILWGAHPKNLWEVTALPPRTGGNHGS